MVIYTTYTPLLNSMHQHLKTTALGKLCFCTQILLNFSTLCVKASHTGHVNIIEVSHCVTLFSHHSHLCHCSWPSPYVSVVLYRHRVKAPQCSRGDYGFLNYHIIFISEYSVPNLLESIYDKIMYHKGLYCTKVWNQFAVLKVEKLTISHWLLWKVWVLKSNFEVEILTHAMV